MVARFGDRLVEAYDAFGPASVAELLGRADQELAAQRNVRSVSTYENIYGEKVAATSYKLVPEVSEDNAPEEKVKNSRIRIELSRPLTWAEKEALETNWDDPHERRIKDTNDGLLLVLNLAPDFQHVWAEAPFGSRILFDLVAAMLEQHFVNVYPTAVRTFREYNGE